MIFEVSWNDKKIAASLQLEGSKSISNRVLILKALCGESFPIHNLSASKDTITLNQLLSSDEDILDTGPAGTTYRFLTAWLCTQDRERILTGSQRMKERPIGPLVEALQSIGARIDYLEKEGYPPIKIYPSPDLGKNHTIHIKASISSQFMTALLLIAPSLPHGLSLHLVGELVSPSYLIMTLKILESFGVRYKWEGNHVVVAPQKIKAAEYVVEADWSGASYLYEIAAFSEDAELELKGLFQNSLQGDAEVAQLMKQFGIISSYTEDGIILKKENIASPKPFSHDFTSCPDIAQTLAVTCAGIGIPGHFSGIQTLNIKETDRVKALKCELAKIGCKIKPNREVLPDEFTCGGHAQWGDPPVFPTYHDHRMAMSFAPLALLAPVQIADPGVVDKSYPEYWRHLSLLGARIQLI